MRKNSDIAVLSDEWMEKPVIERVEPPVLQYDGSLNQKITLYGQHLNEDCLVLVDGVIYPTVYDEATGGQTLALSYERWSEKSSVSVVVRRYCHNDPAQVRNDEYLLNTTSAVHTNANRGTRVGGVSRDPAGSAEKRPNTGAV